MERLNRQADSQIGRLARNQPDAVADLLEVLPGGLARGGTADQHDEGQPKGPRLPQTFTVVLNRNRSLFRGSTGKKAPSHQGEPFQSGIRDVLPDRREILPFQRLPPHRDSPDPPARITLDALGHGPRARGEGVDGQFGIGHGREFQVTDSEFQVSSFLRPRILHEPASGSRGAGHSLS